MPCVRKSRRRRASSSSSVVTSAALAGRHRLDRMERERGHVGAAGHRRPSAPSRRAPSACAGVLDDDARRSRIGASGSRSTGRPAKLTGTTARVALADRCDRCGESRFQRRPRDVDEARPAALVEDAVRRRGEAERGREHLVARAEAGGERGAVQRGGAVRERDHVPRAEVLGDRLARSGRSSGPCVIRSPTQRLGDGVDVVVGDLLPSVREEGLRGHATPGAHVGRHLAQLVDVEPVDRSCRSRSGSLPGAAAPPSTARSCHDAYSGRITYASVRLERVPRLVLGHAGPRAASRPGGSRSPGAPRPGASASAMSVTRMLGIFGTKISPPPMRPRQLDARSRPPGRA